ncbi:hypothetical protein ACWGF3_27175 [Streptomyces xanthophaeus]|uniref:Uncharacterized protein n=1 Tax=Streptomyces xanthophaeus TaxID=67385 RepID=A0A919GU43_9ACTN|nr:hypothetical protein [Streptomyces xanthophaeus]WST27379.1 hypothetical protein OG264_07665 [Streptomyces xanthophaeus]WST65498.1 hypothetical protein OG605_30695 [Streptomyces xanthophaeus]GHI84240.1 hypothetical protein Sxan_16040 [Streptomyces xanthophaeus]
MLGTSRRSVRRLWLLRVLSRVLVRVLLRLLPRVLLLVWCVGPALLVRSVGGMAGSP